MIKKLLARKPQPATVLKSEYDALKREKEYAEKEHRDQVLGLGRQIDDVVEERNKAGTLLLDCLRWMEVVPLTSKQKGGSALIAEREKLMERARTKGWWPVKEEQEENKV